MFLFNVKLRNKYGNRYNLYPVLLGKGNNTPIQLQYNEMFQCNIVGYSNSNLVAKEAPPVKTLFIPGLFD